ncbi:PE-PPE domain-containing protein [Mycobacterium sp.]|uniref:PE-PPE domain-containing protein n=1 Tax=Mycobacterium sp. TaxID=1785 RepID=UPI0031D78352
MSELADRKLRYVGLGLVAGVGAGVLSLTAMMNSAFAYGDVEAGSEPVPFTMPEYTQVMGGSGLPIPSLAPGYTKAADTLFIAPNLPETTPQDLNTPENLYPLYPPTFSTSLEKQLPFDVSVAEGVSILNSKIDPGLTSGTSEGVFGYSQSSTISSLEMEQLDPSGTPSSLPANFVLIGDPNLPNGGLLARFPDLSLPSLGITFSGATPADDFPTAIYTIQYDGFADFPRYPIDLLADVNAFLGIETLHGHYLDLTTEQVKNATLLPGSMSDGATDSMTNYYLIDTAGTTLNPTGLPLANLIYGIPVVGHPLAALLTPDLTYLVNLGYGADNLGYSDTPFNVETPFGLFPDVSPLTVLENLATYTQQGVTDFIHSISSGGLSLSALPDPAAALAGLTQLATDPAAALAALSPADILSGLTTAVDTLSNALSTTYAALLPTADIANALLTSLPAYDLTLFGQGIESIPTEGISGLINAVGLPIAADVALGTLAAGFEFTVVEGTLSQVIGDVSSLLP